MYYKKENSSNHNKRYLILLNKTSSLFIMIFDNL